MKLLSQPLLAIFMVSTVFLMVQGQDYCQNKKDICDNPENKGAWFKTGCESCQCTDKGGYSCAPGATCNTSVTCEDELDRLTGEMKKRSIIKRKLQGRTAQQRIREKVRQTG